MKFQFKNVVIQHGDKFVSGFSLKHQRVYYTNVPDAVLRFTSVSANEFIANYANKGFDFETDQIRIHLLKPGCKTIPTIEREIDQWNQLGKLLNESEKK